jgi:hypothetical protein
MKEIMAGGERMKGLRKALKEIQGEIKMSNASRVFEGELFAGILVGWLDCWRTGGFGVKVDESEILEG